MPSTHRSHSPRGSFRIMNSDTSVSNLYFTRRIVTYHNPYVGKATFFFHGLFPDHIEPDEGTGRQVCKVLFDVQFDGKLHSHLLADIWPVEEKDGVPVFEVCYDLPFECTSFSRAVVSYYQQVMGPQSATISHSGPKGPIPNRNVYRVQWEISLDADYKTSDPRLSRE